MKTGRLLKGGEPCLRSAAIYLIIDFQRGRLPHFVPPPELKDDDDHHYSTVKQIPGIEEVKQNLDDIVDENTKETKGEDDELGTIGETEVENCSQHEVTEEE